MRLKITFYLCLLWTARIEGKTSFEKVGRNMYQSSGWSPWIDLLSTNGWLLRTNGRASSTNTALPRQKQDCVVRTFSSVEDIVSFVTQIWASASKSASQNLNGVVLVQLGERASDIVQVLRHSVHVM